MAANYIINEHVDIMMTTSSWPSSAMRPLDRSFRSASAADFDSSIADDVISRTMLLRHLLDTAAQGCRNDEHADAVSRTQYKKIPGF